MVGVTLGPLITPIIFNLNKSYKAFVFDFSAIAILQTSALIYGMNVMFQARPVFVVFSKTFDLVSANMLSKDEIAKAKHTDYRSLPLTGPVCVYSEMPADIKERNEMVTSAFSGRDMPQFPQFYKPYAEHTSDVAQTAKPISELKKLNPGQDGEIDNAVHTSGRAEAELGFLPLRANIKK